MNFQQLRAVLVALQKAEVRYLIAGGLAVVAHGYGRLTMDVDLAIALDRENILRAWNALASLGYRPLVPVTAEGLADETTRQSWIEDKHMKALNFRTENPGDLAVDVFVQLPFDFEREFTNGVEVEIEEGLQSRVVSLDTLMAMKKEAGRDKDKADLVELERLKKLQDEDD